MSKRRTSYQIATVKALFDYNASTDSCISFKKGDRILVFAKDESGWWDGSVGGTRG
jgi:hypothetical protein